MTLLQHIRRFWRDRKGQDLIEYALIAGFVTLTAIAALPQLFYEPLARVLNTVGSKIDGLTGF